MFDSFDTGTRMPYVEKLADYFRVELERSDIRAVKADVPLQDNFTDCGVYLLHYAEKLLERWVC